MSEGPSCRCPERDKPIKERNWVVRQRLCNHSAFNGYHYTPSEWSSLMCLACNAIWRTKAQYVDDVRDPRGPIRWIQETPHGGRWTDEPERARAK